MEEQKRCDYCHKPIEGEPVKKEIWINGSRREMTFCSEEHAAFRQMAAEG